MPIQRTINISLVPAISARGQDHFKIRLRAFYGESYAQFIAEVVEKLYKDIFLFIRGSRRIIRSTQWSIFLYIVCLSIQLSLFLKLKIHVRKEMTNSVHSLIEQTPHFRIDTLIKIISDELWKPDYHDLCNFHQHMKDYYVPSLTIVEMSFYAGACFL